MFAIRQSSFYRAAVVALAKAYPLMAALVFLGMGYGIYMRSCGFSAVWPVCMAATVFAGSMEFITVGLLLSPFNPLHVVLLTLVVNGRHLFYSVSMLDRYRGTGWKKFGLVSGLIDEAFSLNYITQLSPQTDRNWFMWLVTTFLYLSWISGTALGTLMGATALADMEGVDFVMTALFIVIFISQWQKESSHGASLMGLGSAACLLPLFGKNYFMLPAIVLVALVFSVRWFITKKKTSLL